MNNTELINILDASTYENDELFNIIKSNFNNTDNIELLMLNYKIYTIYKNNMDDLFIVNFDDIYPWIGYTLKENAKGVVWARNKIREELYQGEEYFLQIDSHSRVKKNWDAILINQYNSIEQPKVVITTYPNHFDMPDPEKKYLNLFE